MLENSALLMFCMMEMHSYCTLFIARYNYTQNLDGKLNKAASRQSHSYSRFNTKNEDAVGIRGRQDNLERAV